MRKIAISDLHGFQNTLDALLDKISYTSKDQLFLLGDFVNKGPYSKEILDYIFQLENDGYQVFCIKGNHDLAFENGKCTKITLQSFGVSAIEEIPVPYISFIKNLPHLRFVDEYIIVHGGINFQKPDPFAPDDEMLTIRDWYKDIDYDLLQDRLILHGHTPVTRNIIQMQLSNLDKWQVMNIDNGCILKGFSGFGGLCAFCLNERWVEFQENVDN